jgi:hypothetical protein
MWGITACDGPNGYRARGAPPAQDDDGTIAPTAAGGSMPFTPKESLAALRYMYDTYRNQIWTPYEVFDVSGNEIAALVNGELERGEHVVAFEGQSFPSGIYFYVLTAGKFTQTRKAILVR